MFKMHREAIVAVPALLVSGIIMSLGHWPKEVKELTVLELVGRENMVLTEEGWSPLKTDLCRDQWQAIRKGDRCTFEVTAEGLEPLVIIED